MNDIRKTQAAQLVGLIYQALSLYVLYLASSGAVYMENLYSGWVFVLAFFTCSRVAKVSDRDWFAHVVMQSKGLRAINHLMVGAQVAWCFALGWYWIGSVLLFAALAAYGKTLRVVGHLKDRPGFLLGEYNRQTDRVWNGKHWVNKGD